MCILLLPPPDRQQDEDRMELPEIRLKFLNPPLSACRVSIRSLDSHWLRRWQQQEQQPCERSCQQAKDAHVQLKQSSPLSHPHAPSRLHT